MSGRYCEGEWKGSGRGRGRGWGSHEMKIRRGGSGDMGEQLGRDCVCIDVDANVDIYR